jgi:hypothetical protein
MSCKVAYPKLMCSTQPFGSEVNSAKVDVSHTQPVLCLLHVEPESGANWDQTWSLHTGQTLKTVKDSEQKQ